MNDLEINVDKGLTQALMQKFGQNINGLIDKFNILQFTSSNPSWIVPPNVNFIKVLACGGGGGGGGGGATSDTAGGSAGGGGGGAGCLLTEDILIVTPGDELSINIGAGGVGGAGGIGGFDESFTTNGSAGGNGGDTSIIGPTYELYFPGAAGGAGGLKQARGFPPAVSDNVLGGQGARITYDSQARFNKGGQGSKGFNIGPALVGGRPAPSIRHNNLRAQGGALTGSANDSGGGGGGGGSGFKAGGNGGAGGAVFSNAIFSSAQNASANSGAGGGGGGGAGRTQAGVTGKNGASGGAGGSGIVIFLFTPDQA